MRYSTDWLMLITVGGAIYSPLPTTEMLESSRDSTRLTQTFSQLPGPTTSLASAHLQINLHSHFSSCLPSEAAFSKSPFHWAVSCLLAAAGMDKEEEERRSGSQATPLHMLSTCQEVTVWVWMLKVQKHPGLRNMLTLFNPLLPEHPTLFEDCLHQLEHAPAARIRKLGQGRGSWPGETSACCLARTLLNF